jgi:hypothetical protein
VVVETPQQAAVMKNQMLSLPFCSCSFFIFCSPLKAILLKFQAVLPGLVNSLNLETSRLALRTP